MKLYQSLAILAVFIFSTSLMATNKGPAVIYGEDNRVDVFESTNAAYVELSASTAAMIFTDKIKPLTDGSMQIEGSTLESRGICATERFAKQIATANCSGFLVAENILVTAGHCIETMTDCENYKWVFGYKADHADQSTMSVEANNVYSCKKIISRKLERISQDDFAVIELDRKVTDRAPLKFRRSGKIATGEELVVIGHPSGLPTKIADGASVRKLSAKYFSANLDTYGGNSGSAVFNAKTHEIEGILVRGEEDYVYENGCQVSNKCPATGCRGEDVTYITNIDAIKKL